MPEPTLPDRARVVVDRRRHHRLLGGLSPGARGLERRGAARARQAHVGHDVARGRADGDVRLDLRDLDGDAQVHMRPLRPARSRDRPGDRLHARRLHRDRGRCRPARGVPPRRGVQPPLGVDVDDLAARGEAICSRSRASTTCSRASTSRKTAAWIRWMPPMALAEGRHPRRRAPDRGRAGHRLPQKNAPGGGGAHSATATSRRSTSSTAPACGRDSSAKRSASNPRIRPPSTTT